MSAVMVAGLLVAALAVMVAVRPLSRTTRNDEALLSLRERRNTLEQQIAATQGDRQRGDIDPAFAADEQARLELELLEVLEKIESATDNASQPVDPPQGGAWARLLVLFLLLSVGGGGLYYYNQQQWWQAHLDGTIVSPVAAPETGLPMLADGQPDIGAMVNRLASRLQENPDDGAGWKRLGRSYWVMKRYQESADAYAKAAALLPDDFTLIQGYAMSRMSVMIAEKKSVELAPAIADLVAKLRMRVDANPEEVEGYQAMASVYVMLSQREAAAQMYEQVLERNPDNLSIAVSAASNQFILAEGEINETVSSAYERVAKLDPANRSVIWFRGYDAYKKQNWQQVLDYWEPLLQQLPETADDRQRIEEAVEEARQQLLASASD